MRLTIPQILMLNHAAHVNSKRMDERMAKEKLRKEAIEAAKVLRDKQDPVIPSLGKRISECTSDQIAAQFGAGAW